MAVCFECGRVADHNHHVVPKSKGGTRTVPLCLKCHGKVHSVRRMSTRELTKAALAHKKALNQRVGTVPFGWDLSADGTTLLENTAEQQTIATIRALRASGMTLQAIADHLNASCIFTRRGTKWTATTIRQRLRKCCFDN